MFTNDGIVSHRIQHPRNRLNKTYHAWVEGQLNRKNIQKLRAGIWLKTGLTASAIVEEVRNRGKLTQYQIIIHECKKRQIRKMFEAVGARVDYLKRTRVGSLSLGKLPKGRFRHLQTDEIQSLMNENVK